MALKRSWCYSLFRRANCIQCKGRRHSACFLPPSSRLCSGMGCWGGECASCLCVGLPEADLFLPSFTTSSSCQSAYSFLMLHTSPRDHVTLHCQHGLLSHGYHIVSCLHLFDAPCYLLSRHQASEITGPAPESMGENATSEQLT